ncbi:MAG: response regulator [Phycisphaerales bacterium]|nr:response regulator [Phycisphaerales bacterium]
MGTLAETTTKASRHPSKNEREMASENARFQKKKRRVLLVDDEDNIRTALKRLLRREDYEICAAANGREALRILEVNPVQLIVSDYRMPGMTGVELLREIRQRWPDTVRIILSGFSEVNAIIAAINEGEIYKFLSKPWNDEEIKLHIRRALEQHELEEENRRMADEIAEQNESLREFNLMLEQRASDASVGLTSAQNLLEHIGVGVLSVDLSGLIVGANRCAVEIVSSDSGLIGIPAKVALPKALCRLSTEKTAPDNGLSERLELNGRTFQCRVNPLVIDNNHRGNIVALWEEVPCT